MASKKRKPKKRTYGGGTEYRDKRSNKLIAAYRIGGKPVRLYAADTTPAAEARLTEWRQALQALEAAGYDLAAVPRDVLFTFSDSAAVDAWKETVDTFQRHHTKLDKATETVQTFAQRWMDDELAHRDGRTGDGLALGTWRAYRQSLELYILPAFGATPMREMLDTYAIERWRNETVRAAGAKSARNAWTVLGDMLSTAVRWKVIPYHPMRESKPPRVVSRTPHPLTIPELHRLYAVVEDDPLELVYHVASLLGLRIAECLGLLWAGVDWKAATLAVSGQVQTHGTTRRLPRTKSGKTRAIPIPSRLLDALRRHYERQREWAKAENWKEHGLIFATSIGTPIVPRNMERHWAGDDPDWKPRAVKPKKKYRVVGVRERAGLPADVVFHDFRHTCGALLESVGASDAVRRAIFGHSGQTVTDGYTHAFAAQVRQAVEDVERLVWNEATTEAMQG
jgi:integrase